MADEPNAGGSFPGAPTGNRWMRALRAVTGQAQAGLKFDIPGLQAFQREIKGIQGTLVDLRKEFERLSKAPKDFADQLERVNTQLRTMKTTGLPTTGSTFGQAPNMIAVPSNAPSQQQGGGGFGGAMTSIAGFAGGGGGAGGAMQIASVIGNIFQKGMDSAVARFNQNMDTTTQADAFFSRMALSTGVRSQTQLQQLGRNGMPLLGTLQENAAVMGQFAQMGNVMGGPGISGQRGAAAMQGAAQIQFLAPGISAPAAASAVAGMQTNVRGINQARAIFGNAVNPYGAGGKLRTMTEIFKSMWDFLIRNARTGTKKGVPYTKAELTAIRIPGSNIYSWLSAAGWTDDVIQYWFDWAMGQATEPTGGTFTPSDKSMKDLRGDSLATTTQQTAETQATREARMGGDQYKNYITAQDIQQKQIQAMSDLEHAMRDLIGALGKGGPLSRNVGNAVNTGLQYGVAASVFGPEVGVPVGLGAAALSYLGVPLPHLGDPGDNGLSQMNPDVRGRVGAMMAANPNLRVNSGYRSPGQQRKLWQSGNPYAAPPGKSAHGRGAAADIGPASQYGWIAKNARRFGLETAGHMGEPWHIQLAGTLGLGDANSFQDQLDRANQMHLQAMRLIAAKGGKAGTGGSAGVGSGGGGGGGAPTTASIPAPGAGPVAVSTVLKALYDDGVRGEDLITLASIPARESHYNPLAHNVGPKDDSYGIFQVNMLGNLAPGREAQLQAMTGSIAHEQLYDPLINIQMAANLYKSAGLNPWNIKRNGVTSPLFDVPDEAISAARKEAQSMWPTGYGDAGASAGPAFNAPQGGTGHTFVFNNNFNVAMTNTAGGSQDLDGLARDLSGRLENQFRSRMATRR